MAMKIEVFSGKKVQTQMKRLILSVTLVWFTVAGTGFAADPSLPGVARGEPIAGSSQPRQEEEPVGLLPADESALGDRTPLILVHGNNSESFDKNRWGDWIDRALQDQNFTSRYKMYLYRWNSRLSNPANGAILGQTIDNTDELDNREIVLLGYSRGGIIARYFMNHYLTRKGDFTDQLGGERVRYLVTLATPHRGSPGADPAWTLFSLDYNYDSALLGALTRVYDEFYDTDTDVYLLWDDADNELTDDTVCWEHDAVSSKTLCRAPYSKYSDLSLLNRQERYFNKIVAFGGNVYTGRPVATDDPDQIKDFDEWTSHEGLGVFSILMAQMPVIPNGYRDNESTPIDDSYRPFRANDGLVPLTSALFLRPGAGRLFDVASDGSVVYDEAQLGALCQAAQCNVIRDRRVDHLDFMDDEEVIRLIIAKMVELGGGQ